MRPVLHIDGGVLRGGTEALWKPVLDHTGCEDVTTVLIAALARAAREAPIDHCLLCPAEGVGSGSGVRAWQLRVVHAGAASD